MLERKRYLCDFKLASRQSGVKTVLLGFENHSQNVPQPNPKMHSDAIFQPSVPETWQECFHTTLQSNRCSATGNVVLCVPSFLPRSLPFLYNEVVYAAIREGYHKYVTRRINSPQSAAISRSVDPELCYVLGPNKQVS